MSLTFSEITARLASIAELIAKIEHEHLLTNTASFHDLKDRLTKLNNRIWNTITKDELENFEQTYCCQTLLDHLDSSSALYNVPWNRPQTKSIPKKNCIPWLNQQYDAYIQPFLTEVHDKKRAKVGKQPVRIIDSDEPDNAALASNQLLSLQLQKLKPLFVEVKAKHSDLFLKQSQFKKASSTTLANVTLIQWQNDYQKDSELGQSIIDEISEKLCGLPFTDDSYKEQGLLLFKSIATLKKLNNNREVLAEQIFALQELVFPNDKQSEQQLAELRLHALESLKKTLHSFVYFVIEIDAKNKGPEFQDFTQALDQFITNFTNDLAEGTTVIANSAEVVKLKNLLSHSINADRSLSHSTEQNNASSDAITDLMNGLFSLSTKVDDGSEKNTLLYRKQIERIYSIRAKLQDRAIEKSAQYFRFQQTIMQTRATIIDETNINKDKISQLDSKITALITELELKCKLILFNSPLYTTAHERIVQLMELKAKFNSLLEEITAEASSTANSTTLHALLKRFEDATSTEAYSQALKEITQLKESTDEKLKQQVEIHDRIETMQKDCPDVVIILQQLDTFYKKERTQLHSALTAKITEATMALDSLGWNPKQTSQTLKDHIDLSIEIVQKNLSLTRSQDKINKAVISLDTIIAEVNVKRELHQALQDKMNDAIVMFELLGWTKDKINHQLKQHVNLSSMIRSKNSPLALIKTHVKDALVALDTRINDAETTFRNTIATQQESIQKICFSLSNSARELAHYGNQDISCYKNLRNDTHTMDITHHDYQNHILEFTTSSDVLLKPWYDDYCIKYRDIQNSVNACNNALVDAQKVEKEIKRRLNTPAYKISQTILLDLQKEFNRILVKHINHASEISANQKNILLEHKDDLIFTRAYSEAVNTALQQIDPRLSKLKTIYAQFEKINHDYTYKHHPSAALDHKRLDNDYINTLQERANESLRSPNMEHMSDGVRSEFIQWIRNHIVKPLQHLGKKHPFVFFPTKWACRTEKALVEKGNDAYQQLTQLTQLID